MSIPTYREYLENPEVRERLAREAHRARAEAFHDFIVAPVSSLLARVKRLRVEPRIAHSLRLI